MLGIHKYLVIIIGSFFLAIGIHLFLMPHLILDGGLIGIALMINYLYGMRIGLVILLCSLPLFVCMWRFDREMVWDSMIGMMVSSFMIDVCAPFQYVFIYYVSLTALTSSLIGGLLLGLGFGLMLRYDTSTGGIDLLAQFLAKKMGWNMGIMILLSDAIIIGLGGILISLETLYYSLITIASGGFTTYVLTLNKYKK